MKHLLPILTSLLLVTGSATAQVASRLTGWSLRTIDSSAQGASSFLLDSMHYTYSGSRGSNVIFSGDKDESFMDAYSLIVESNYDEAVNVKYVPYLHSYSRYETNRSSKAYNAQNNCETEEFDFWDTVTNSWVTTNGKMQYYYSPGNVLAETISSTGGVLKEKAVYEYDVNGNNTLITRYTYWQSSQDWHPSMRDTNAYDAGNHRIFWATQWPGKNNDWALGEYTTCTYTPGGKLATYDVSRTGGKGKLRFFYTQSGDTAITTMEQWDITGQFWFVCAISKELRDGAGRLTNLVRSARSSVPNSPMTTVIHEWKYNSYGQVTDHIQRSGYSYYNIEHTRYYYETYITGINANTGALYLLVYPNPAANTLHLGMTFANVPKIDGVITDLTGKVCAQWSDKAAGLTTLNKSIDVSNLAPGTYFLRLLGNSQSETKTFTVVR